MFEKRKFPRLGESWDIDYQIIRSMEIKNNTIDGLTVNISGGGICFQANEEIPKGTMLAIELKSAEFNSSIMALAKTVWCKEKDINVYDVGAEFWWTGWKSNNSQKAMLNYVSKQLSEKKA